MGALFVFQLCRPRVRGRAFSGRFYGLAEEMVVAPGEADLGEADFRKISL